MINFRFIIVSIYLLLISFFSFFTNRMIIAQIFHFSFIKIKVLHSFFSFIISSPLDSAVAFWSVLSFVILNINIRAINICAITIGIAELFISSRRVKIAGYLLFSVARVFIKSLFYHFLKFASSFARLPWVVQNHHLYIAFSKIT